MIRLALPFIICFLTVCYGQECQMIPTDAMVPTECASIFQSNNASMIVPSENQIQLAAIRISEIRMIMPRKCRRALIALICQNTYRTCVTPYNNNTQQLSLEQTCHVLSQQCPDTLIAGFIESASPPLQYWWNCSAVDLVAYQLFSVYQPLYTPEVSSPSTLSQSIPVSTCLTSPCCREPFDRNPNTLECGFACPFPLSWFDDYQRAYSATQFTLFVLGLIFIVPFLIFWCIEPKRRIFPAVLPFLIVLCGFVFLMTTPWAFITNEWDDIAANVCVDDTTIRTSDNTSSCMAEGVIAHWSQLTGVFFALALSANMVRTTYKQKVDPSRMRMYGYLCFLGGVLFGLAFVIGVVASNGYASLPSTPCLPSMFTDTTLGKVDIWFPIGTLLIPMIALSLGFIMCTVLTLYQLHKQGGWHLIKQQIRIIVLLFVYGSVVVVWVVIMSIHIIPLSEEMANDADDYSMCTAANADNIFVYETACQKIADESAHFNVGGAVFAQALIISVPIILSIVLGWSDRSFFRGWKAIILCRWDEIGSSTSESS